jgi:hypothetical protein
MRIVTGKVIEGKVVIDGAPFQEGARVTVIGADDSETFELGPEDEAALLAAIGEANHGEIVDGVELVAKLSSHDRSVAFPFGSHGERPAKSLKPLIGGATTVRRTQRRSRRD